MNVARFLLRDGSKVGAEVSPAGLEVFSYEDQKGQVIHALATVKAEREFLKQVPSKLLPLYVRMDQALAKTVGRSSRLIQRHANRRRHAIALPPRSAVEAQTSIGRPCSSRAICSRRLVMCSRISRSSTPRSFWTHQLANSALKRRAAPSTHALRRTTSKT